MSCADQIHTENTATIDSPSCLPRTSVFHCVKITTSVLVERQLENAATELEHLVKRLSDDEFAACQRFPSPEEARSKIEHLKREETELLKQQVTLLKQKNLCLVQQQQNATVAGGSMCCLCFESYRWSPNQVTASLAVHCVCTTHASHDNPHFLFSCLHRQCAFQQKS
jgi:hypothetical protein